MAAELEPTHGDVIEAIRSLIGQSVFVDMRSGAAGDHLMFEGVLRKLKSHEEEGTMLVIDSGYAILYLHPFRSSPVVHRYVAADGGVMVTYENACVFRCVPATSERDD